MKEYLTIGELLKDFRKLNKMSKVKLAALFDVDVMTVNRWETNITLLKPDKEEEMVDITFIPYQVIRNLNAPISIPTFYDFKLRKYSISKFSNELPDLNWIKSLSEMETNRLRPINKDSDIELIRRASIIQDSISKPISSELIRSATNLLPDLNYILFDTSGFYSGHSVFFPLKREIYQKIRNRTMAEDEITSSDFVDYKNVENPVFYVYDINADCNENLFYISFAIKSFFDKLNKKHTYASYTSRYDAIKMNEQIGNTLVWEDSEKQKELNSDFAPRLYERNRDA